MDIDINKNSLDDLIKYKDKSNIEINEEIVNK
jgi:hypothetical protein